MNKENSDKIQDVMVELNEIRKWINADRNKFDSKTRYLISYAVIKSSGAVEVIFKHIIFDFLATSVPDETEAYLEKMILDSSCNPNTGNMSNMLQNISPSWKEKFDREVKESGCKDKINSLVQLRNDFAHGDSINVSIDTVITYFNSSVTILEILDRVVGEN